MSSGHVLSLLLGYLAKQFWEDSKGLETSLVNAVQESGQVASDRCLRACAPDPPDCGTQIIWNHSFQFHLALHLLTFTCGGGLVILLWWCCARRSTQTSVITVSSDLSPSAAEQRRRLAQLQLAQVKARARKNESP